MSSARRNKRADRAATLPANAPSRWGIYLSVLLGAVLFLSGLWSFAQAEPPPRPYSTALVVAGFLGVSLSWFALRLSRVAWSFLLSLDATAALVFLFGAAKVRDTYDVHLLLGLVPAVLFGVATWLVATGSDEY